MSRAINLALSEEEVKQFCKTAAISISAIEPLPDGGTHLVCTTAAGADAVRAALAATLIEGAVKRHRFYRPPAG